MSNTGPGTIRLIGVTLCIALALALVINRAFAQNSSGTPQQSAMAEKSVEETQKNIQVLKGLPQSELVPVMNYMSASLGVKCGYCHVNKDNNWDFSSDEKGEKKTARKMITMVQGINKTSFNGNTEITCYSCHRGRTSPMGTPQLPIAEASPRPEGPRGPGFQRPALPTVDQILDKYTEALGGSAAIEKLKSRVMKGTVTSTNGNSFGYELYQSGTEKVLAVITAEQGITERGFNGAVGWEKGGRGVRDLSPDEVYYLRRYPDLLKDVKLKEQFTRLNVAGKPKIDGRDVYVLRGLTTSGKREQLFFDAETGLLIRRTSSTPTLVGNIPEQVDFEDYRDVDGVKMPFTVKVASIDPFYSITRKFTEIRLNVPIDDKRFNKPA
jgi:photosynthetic reaction center cytochrome c subunit